MAEETQTIDSRLLGPTEFQNLSAELTQQFVNQGITDTNVINKTLEEQFFTRQGGNISLLTNAPTVAQAIQGLQDFAEPRADEIDASVGIESAVDLTQGPSTVESLSKTLTNTALTTIDQSLANNAVQQEQEAAQKLANKEAEIESLVAERDEALGTSNTERLDQLHQEFKTKELNKELNAKKAEIVQLQQSRQLGLNNIDDRIQPLEVSVGQKASLERRALALISGKVAEAALLQDQISYATATIDQYYGAARDDRIEVINRFDTLLDLARTDAFNFSQEERAAVEEQKDILRTQNERELAQKDEIKALFLDNAEAWGRANLSLDMSLEEIGPKLAAAAKEIEEEALTESTVLDLFNKYPDSGIDPFSDTLEQARAKLPNSLLYRKATKLSGSTTTPKLQPSTGFFNSDIESSIRENAVDLAPDIVEGILSEEKAFRQIRTLYSVQEATDTAIRNVLATALGTNAVGDFDFLDIGETTLPGEVVRPGAILNRPEEESFSSINIGGFTFK